MATNSEQMRAIPAGDGTPALHGGDVFDPPPGGDGACPRRGGEAGFRHWAITPTGRSLWAEQCGSAKKNIRQKPTCALRAAAGRRLSAELTGRGRSPSPTQSRRE